MQGIRVAVLAIAAAMLVQVNPLRAESAPFTAQAPGESLEESSRESAEEPPTGAEAPPSPAETQAGFQDTASETETTVARRESPWSFELTPYLWAAGIDGDVTVQDQEVDVDIGFDDLVDEVDAAGSLLGEARYRQWSFWAQADYLDLTTDKVTQTPLGGLDSELNAQSSIGTVAVGYKVGDWQQGSTLDVYLGARQLSLDNELDVQGTTVAESDDTITDAVVIVSPNVRLSDNWHFQFPVSYGTGDSDQVWSIWPQLQFKITGALIGRVGYRRLHYDIDEGDNEFDAAFHGATLGIGFRF